MKTNWIKVEHRLPKELGKYLIIDPNGLNGNDWEVAHFSNYTNTWHLNNGDIVHPTFWMELPPKPKSETDASQASAERRGGNERTSANASRD